MVCSIPVFFARILDMCSLLFVLDKKSTISLGFSVAVRSGNSSADHGGQSTPSHCGTTDPLCLPVRSPQSFGRADFGDIHPQSSACVRSGFGKSFVNANCKPRGLRRVGPMAKSKKERGLDEPSARIRVCTRCPLHGSRTHAVPGDGKCAAQARVEETESHGA